MGLLEKAAAVIRVDCTAGLAAARATGGAVGGSCKGKIETASVELVENLKVSVWRLFCIKPMQPAPYANVALQHETHTPSMAHV